VTVPDLSGSGGSLSIAISGVARASMIAEKIKFIGGLQAICELSNPWFILLQD